MSGPDPFSRAEVEAAMRRSVLASLPALLRDQVLSGAVRSEVSKGRLLEGPPLALVVAGLVRVSLAGVDGRRFAVTYLRQGDLAGLARLTGRRYPLLFDTITDCRLLRFDPSVVDDLWRGHPEVGVAVAGQLNRHIDDILYETGLGVFGHVRQRVLRHLLALAVVRPGASASCEITHQQLADAVGAVRETVSRVIGALKAEGLLTGDHGVLVIPDPEKVRQETIR